MRGVKGGFAVLVFIAFFSGMCFAQQPKTAAYYYEQGRSFQLNENWYDAIGQYLEATKLNPSYAQAWYALAECSYSLQEYSLALTYLDSAQKFLGATDTIQNLRGFTLIGLGKLEEARAEFTQILEKYPNNANARFGLAELDLFDGKVSAAEVYYLDALSRNPENKQALLSLALISQALDKTDTMKIYIEQALRFHGDNPEVHYISAYINAQEGDLLAAENYARSAIFLQEDYDKAYELLASVLFTQKKWQDVVDVCNYRISKDRNLVSAWYVKAVALQELHLDTDALDAFQTALEINTEDEVMRAAAEQLVRRLSIEDPRRPYWARWHIQKASEAANKYLFAQAKYEYRRALSLDPQNVQTRLDYAGILLSEGYPEMYVSHLSFIEAQGNNQVAVTDKLEAYESLLKDSLAKNWRVDPFYLDKSHWKIRFYYEDNTIQMLHPGANRVTVNILSEIVSSNTRIDSSAHIEPVSGYADAFKRARESGQDYFALVSFEENERELSIQCSVYVARTGSLATQYSVYRIGNGRFSDALRKLEQSISAALPLRARLISRDGTIGLLDAGKIDGLEVDKEFSIIKNGAVKTADSSIGVLYDESDVFGTIKITEVSEELAEGTIKKLGYFDRINIGDEIVLAPIEEAELQMPAVDTQKPALLEIIQSID